MATQTSATIKTGGVGKNDRYLYLGAPDLIHFRGFQSVSQYSGSQ